MTDTSRSKKVYCLWDESAYPKLNVSGDDVVRAIRAFGSKIGAVKAVNFYVDLSGSSSLPSALASELQCSGVSIINTASNGRQGAASKTLLADVFNHVMGDPTLSSALLVVSADPDLGYAISMLRLRGQEVLVVCPRGADTSLLRLSEGKTLDDNVLEPCPYLSIPILHSPSSPEWVIEGSVIENNTETDIATPETTAMPSGSQTRSLDVPAAPLDPAGEGSAPFRPSIKSHSFAGEMNDVDDLEGGSVPPELSSLWNSSFPTQTPSKQQQKKPEKKQKERMPSSGKRVGEETPKASPDDALEGTPNITHPAATTSADIEIPGSPILEAFVAPVNASASGVKAINAAVAVGATICSAVADKEGSVSIPLPPPSSSGLAETMVDLCVEMGEPFQAPATIPTHFQPLVEVMREQFAVGQHVLLPEELVEPVLARRPQILDDANVASEKKPWKSYLRAAEDAAVIVTTWSQGRKTFSLPPAYCSDLRSVDATVDDFPTLHREHVFQGDSNGTKKGIGIPTHGFSIEEPAGGTAEEELTLPHAILPVSPTVNATPATVSPDTVILSTGKTQPTISPSARSLTFVSEINGVDHLDGKRLPYDLHEQRTTFFQKFQSPTKKPPALRTEVQVFDRKTLTEEVTEDVALDRAVGNQSTTTQPPPASDAFHTPSSHELAGNDTTCVQLATELVQETHSVLVTGVENPPLSVDDKRSSQILEVGHSLPSPMPSNDATTLSDASQAEVVTSFHAPSTVPAYLHPLIDFLGEKLAAGTHRVSQSELVEPLLTREPQVLNQAGLASRKKPWKHYINAAHKAGVVVAVKSPVAETTVSLTAMYRCASPSGGNQGGLGKRETTSFPEPYDNEQATRAAEEEAESQGTLATGDAMTLAFMGCVEAVETCPATQKWPVLFKKLPDRQIYPEYYASVQRPISLAEIRSNVAAGAYQDVEGFKADMKLLFENARAYYREGSWMATVAEEMKTVFQSYANKVLDRMQLLTPNDPGFVFSEAAQTSIPPSYLVEDATLPDNDQTSIVSLPQILPSPSLTNVPEIIVDASFTGIGFVFRSKWCSWKLRDSWRSPERHITWAELVAIELGLRTAIAMGVQSSPLRVRSDSQAAIYVLKTHKTRNSHEKVILDQILWLERAYMIQLLPVWIWTKVNPADAISRQRYPSAAQRLGDEPLLPPHLTDYVEASYPTMTSSPDEPAGGDTTPSESHTKLECLGGISGVLGEAEGAPSARPANNKQVTLPAEEEAESQGTLATGDAMTLAFMGCVEAVETCPATQKWPVLFKKLPDRQIYPEYYASVQRPISLAEIRSNITAGSYQDVEAFEVDMKLLFENARAYYRKGSWMATVAQEMEAVFKTYADKVLDRVYLLAPADPGFASSEAARASIPTSLQAVDADSRASLSIFSSPSAQAAAPPSALVTPASSPVQVATLPIHVPAATPSTSISKTAPSAPAVAPAASGAGSSTILPVFQPLIQHFRLLRRQGKLTAKRCNLGAPLLQLDPNIFVKAGTARFNKPVKSYLANAVDLGILKKQKKNNYELHPKYW